jgi:hypothetical protein
MRLFTLNSFTLHYEPCVCVSGDEMKASVFIALLVFALTAPGGWSLPDFCLQHHPTGE